MCETGSQPDETRRNREDFINLFLMNQRRILAFIMMFVPNRSDAEDLMQETASWMWENFDKYTPGTNFGAWAIKIVRFKILKLNYQIHNSRIKFKGDLVDLVDKKAETVLHETDRKVHILRKCLLGLRDRDRRLVYLRYEKGLTPKKMAVLVERPVHGLYKTLARIHKILFRCVRRTLALEGEK